MTGTNEILLKKLAIAAIGLARSRYDETQFNHLDIGGLQQTLKLVSECVPLPYSADPLLLLHTVDCLLKQYNTEETVMHIFLLYIYRLVSEGSRHPLERGIVRQKIMGILPIFEQAQLNGLIRPAVYDRNADALAHIADDDNEVPALIDALAEEYRRLDPSC
ncbi:MAG TPA: hypothetical protein VIN71_10095 [Pseudomonadales bacterium]